MKTITHERQNLSRESQVNYDEFIMAKNRKQIASGFDPRPITAPLFPWQRKVVEWACRTGKAALFEDCGLGKTLQQLEWAHQVCMETGGSVLILTPLSVSGQTMREAEKFGIAAKVCADQSECEPGGISITNYEKLEHFTPEFFSGVVLDESSILKNFTGKLRKRLTDAFARTPYRLCCTATPSPNNYTEFGQHADFLGVCSLMQMLSTFFINDTFNVGDWRLKKHAESHFWEWVASWAACISKPSDIGYDDTGYILPPLNLKSITVGVDETINADPEQLFRHATMSATTMHKEMRMTSPARVAKVAELVNGSDEQWIVWCNTNDESGQLAKAIPDAVEVRGSDTARFKELAASWFVGEDLTESELTVIRNGYKYAKSDERPTGKRFLPGVKGIEIPDELRPIPKSGKRVLISKAGIFGYGMNFQHCHNIAFVGLSYSFEDFYQALRRSYRFGQEREVNAYIVQASTEGAIVRTINRKIEQHKQMQERMKIAAAAFVENEKKTQHMKTDIDTTTGTGWTLHHGDCVRVAKEIESESIDFSVFSPPFADLFTYSDDLQDMGNCADLEEFRKHFEILIEEMARILKPGREVAVHCVDLLSTKWKTGRIEFQDFSGEIIRMFWKHGFLFHSRICIWKSPVTEMQRTKAHGLLYKTLKADSCDSRVGCADYLLVFRKPGINPNPVTKDPDRFPVDWWQEVASPVWMTVDQGRVLNRSGARDHADERHICPLQLDVIERALALWTNEGDLVYSPFAGIGSEGVVSLEMDRRFVGSELKASYFKQACQNLSAAKSQLTFSLT